MCGYLRILEVIFTASLMCMMSLFFGMILLGSGAGDRNDFSFSSSSDSLKQISEFEEEEEAVKDDLVLLIDESSEWK